MSLPTPMCPQHVPVVCLAGAPTSVQLPDGSCVVRRIINSDNSCLFNAVGYVMEHSRARATELRRVRRTPNVWPGTCIQPHCCLVNAAPLALHLTRDLPSHLQVIAAVVAGDPETYSEAFLGKPNAEYCSWILQPSKCAPYLSLYAFVQSLAYTLPDQSSGLLQHAGQCLWDLQLSICSPFEMVICDGHAR